MLEILADCEPRQKDADSFSFVFITSKVARACGTHVLLITINNHAKVIVDANVIVDFVRAATNIFPCQSIRHPRI